jgi:hypothetical protein
MKKTLLLIALAFTFYGANAQCTPNALYQDSAYNIWPDTIINLPYCQQGVPYLAVLDIKTPSTLIEAASGDSSLTTIDTLGQSFYVGDWPVNSMELVQVIGMPAGLSLNCNEPNCVLDGDILTCAYVDGTTNDLPGVYPVEILINVYTSGDITYTVGGFPVTIPVTTDLYSATGSYESITGYEIVIGLTGNVELHKSNELYLYQNIPNPLRANTKIQFNSPSQESVSFEVTDLMGKVIYSEIINPEIGVNSILLEKDFAEGVYSYSINNGKQIVSKRMVVVE